MYTGWTKLHSDVLHNLSFYKCYRGDQDKNDKLGVPCSMHGTDRKLT
jgi:hypothetical protein